MKKLLLALLVFSCYYTQAQFINQFTLVNTFTPQDIDSVFDAQGLPQGVLPITYGAKVYRMLYNTVNPDSTPTVASGLVIVPVGAPCRVPVISYQHGTVLRKTDVPSNFAGEWFIALAAATRGLIGVMPDYLGMGVNPGLHPYQHAHSEATATIDLIRAAKEGADTAGAPVSDQLFLMGYSQGGHATMAAHQLIQQQLDDVMHVTASAPMSGAYDMSGVMSEVMLSDSAYEPPFYLPYLFFGFNRVYNIFNQASDVMVEPYATTLPPLFDGTYDGSQIDNVMPTVPKLIMRQDQIDSFANYPDNYFRVLLRKNDTYNWIPTSPIKMYFCTADRQVNYRNSIVAYHKFLDNGTDPSLIDTQRVSTTLDHRPCADFAILGGVNWLSSFVYDDLSASLTHTNASTANSTDGTASVTPVGGNPGHTFNWSNGDTSQSISGLGAGKYYVTVTDESQCAYTDSVTVSIGTGFDDMILSDVRIYPNPAKGTINIQAGEQLDEIKLYDVSGQQLSTYTVANGVQTQVLIADYADGIYYLQVKSNTGKQLRRKIVLLNE